MSNMKKNFFEELFDQTTFIKRRMIFLLNQTNGYWVTAKWLSDNLGVSKRVTLGIINDLSKKINQLDTEKFCLEYSRGRGIRLNVARDADIHYLAAEVVRECHTVKIFEAILTEEFDTVKNYALENFISESTVRRCLNRIRILLSRYQIKLGREKNWLLGEEKQIRMFMIIFFWGVYRGRVWPFKFIDEQRIQTYVNNVLSSNFTVQSEIPYAYKKQIAYIFAEGIIRARKNKLVEFSMDEKKMIFENVLYKSFREQFTKIDGASDIKNSEIPFFFCVWLSMSKTTEIFTNVVFNNLLKDNRDRQTFIYTSTEFVIDNFQKHFFTIDEDKIWRFWSYIFSSHWFAYFFKSFNTDITGNTYKDIFSDNYPILIKKTESFLDELFIESKNDLFIEKEFLLIPYLKSILSLGNPCMYEIPIKVLVESDMPNLLTNTLINQVYGYFSCLYNITIFSNVKTKANEIDILLTTGTLKDIEILYPNASVVVIEKKISISDLDKVSKALKEVSIRKNSKSIINQNGN